SRWTVRSADGGIRTHGTRPTADLGGRTGGALPLSNQGQSGSGRGPGEPPGPGRGHRDQGRVHRTTGRLQGAAASRGPPGGRLHRRNRAAYGNADPAVRGSDAGDAGERVV